MWCMCVICSVIQTSRQKSTTHSRGIDKIDSASSLSKADGHRTRFQLKMNKSKQINTLRHQTEQVTSK